MPKKKTKVSKKEKEAARKKADELVEIGNGHLETALAARKQNNLAATLEGFTLAENSYQEATKVNLSVHLDSLYNLGVCQAMRANIYYRQRKQAESLAARTLAKQYLDGVIAGDTSGRSETLALAHKAMASLLTKGAPGMIEKETGKQEKNLASDAIKELQLAINHINIAITIETNSGNLANVVSAHLQAGDLHALAMRWSFRMNNINEAFTNCETACSHFDEGLSSPVPVDDLQLLEQKIRVLHGLCSWATENDIGNEKNSLHLRLLAALNDADETVKTLLLIPPEVVAKEKGFGELYIVMGDICEMNKNSTEALRLYEKAVEIKPIADAYAGAADLLLDEGRAKMNSATDDNERAAAVELLQRSANAFNKAAKLEPNQNNEHIYNLACATALANDETKCKQALADLKKKIEIGGKVGTEAAELLSDTAEDADFDSVREMEWFIEAVKKE